MTLCPLSGYEANQDALFCQNCGRMLDSTTRRSYWRVHLRDHRDPRLWLGLFILAAVIVALLCAHFS
jgi:hypothetical protein